MLFNSFEFILIFLPITLMVFFIIGNRGHHRIAIAWVVAASLFFYGWWNLAYLGLIVGSMLFNYAVGIALSSHDTGRYRKAVLIFGIVSNLGVLAYFKYANFFVDNLNGLELIDFNLQQIILPLAISFFTFQQITYLVDSFRNQTHEFNFLHYCLFVTFFPQLIAGPIVHHKEMMPQFVRDSLYQFNARHVAVGLTIFALGLFKKVVLADGVAVYATPAFNAADSGVALSFFEAWAGALAYTFQLYFDFSGYSDMAIGLARMFGIRLPLNFNSPYKATNIINFWRRWHITLSRFLRDYLYIPLGGNRKGNLRRHTNILITMLLGGLWHGAGWNFMLWGGLHGIYLVVNNLWRSLFPGNTSQTRLARIVSWGLTFIAIVVAWVPFRAETIDGVKNVWSGMLGLNGFSLPIDYVGRLGGLESWLMDAGVVFNGMFSQVNELDGSFGRIILLFIIALAFPNTQQVMARYRPAYVTYKNEIASVKYRWLLWRPTRRWALISIMLLVFGLTGLTRINEFLYFQF